MTLIATAFQKGSDGSYSDTVDFEDIFVKNLLFVLKTPNSFKYNFPLLSSQHSDYNPWRINIIYSDDSLFRIFNWLSPTSGTWYYFPAIFQAKNKLKNIIYSYPRHSEGSQPSTSYEAVYRIEATGKQLYVCLGHGQYSGRLPFDIVETYEVNKDSIIRSDILPDNKHFVSAIMVDRQSTTYDSSSQDIPNIVYVKKQRLLKIPEITGNYDLPDNIKWTGRLILLKFNGSQFSKPIK